MRKRITNPRRPQIATPVISPDLMALRGHLSIVLRGLPSAAKVLAAFYNHSSVVARLVGANQDARESIAYVSGLVIADVAIERRRSA